MASDPEEAGRAAASGQCHSVHSKLCLQQHVSGCEPSHRLGQVRRHAQLPRGVGEAARGIVARTWIRCELPGLHHNIDTKQVRTIPRANLGWTPAGGKGLQSSGVLPFWARCIAHNLVLLSCATTKWLSGGSSLSGPGLFLVLSQAMTLRYPHANNSQSPTPS